MFIIRVWNAVFRLLVSAVLIKYNGRYGVKPIDVELNVQIALQRFGRVLDSLSAVNHSHQSTCSETVRLASFEHISQAVSTKKEGSIFSDKAVC